MAVVAALPLRRSLRAEASGPDATGLVLHFYELIDAYRYEEAYTLLGEEWRAQQSLDQFTRGYWNTAFVQCRTTSATTSGDATTVSVELISWHNDGAIVAYAGTYRVGREHGKLALVGRDVVRTDAPAKTAALCGVNDLRLEFGRWQGAAGSREGAIRATNTSGTACMLGGSPRITLNDAAGNMLVSTSDAGSPPEAVVLGPGGCAQAAIRFSNWCGVTRGMVSVRAELPGSDATAPVDGGQGISYPPCNGPGQPASLEVRGWTR